MAVEIQVPHKEGKLTKLILTAAAKFVPDQHIEVKIVSSGNDLPSGLKVDTDSTGIVIYRSVEGSDLSTYWQFVSQIKSEVKKQLGRDGEYCFLSSI